jgi:hypothetical protein
MPNSSEMIDFACSNPTNKPRSPWHVIILLLSALSVIFVVVCLFLLYHKNPGASYSKGPCYVPPGGRTTAVAGVPYQYIAPPYRQASIDSGLPKLKQGMSRKEVRGIMGDPDIDQGAFVPTVFNPRGEYRGVIWRYIVRSVEPEGTNVNDDVIELEFTTDDHLDSIYDSRSHSIMPPGFKPTTSRRTM